MIDQVRDSALDEGEYVVFVTAGTAVTGEYHCSSCAYGVTVHGKLPRCPMCDGTTWEQAAWSPFSRARSETYGFPP